MDMERNYSKSSMPRIQIFCWWICGCMAITGCSAPPIEVNGSSEMAAQAVAQVLNAWKDGTSLTQFRDMHPDFVVADEDWQQGVELKSYTTVEPARINGSHWRQKVELRLVRKAKVTVTNAYYAVTIGQSTSVLRSDFDY
jgi:hypothetical protein